MLGRGVRGVWGSCLRPPRPGVLAPDVDIKGLPLTEPLPYMKKGTANKNENHIKQTQYTDNRVIVMMGCREGPRQMEGKQEGGTH